MRNLVLTIVVTTILVVGCATQQTTRTDWRRSVLSYVDSPAGITAADHYLKEAGLVICIDADKDEIARSYRKSIIDCIHEVSDKMPVTVSHRQSEAFGHEVDSCAAIRLSKQYFDSWSLTNVPTSKHKKCLEVYQTMERVKNLE